MSLVKSADIISNRKKYRLPHQFHYTIQNPTLSRARNISETLIDAYRTKKVDEIYLIYIKHEKCHDRRSTVHASSSP